MGRPLTKIELEYIHQYRDRHGKLRNYVRRPRCKLVPLPGAPGSEEFMQAYQRAIANEPEKAPRFKPNTLGKMIADFYASPIFKNNLSDSSKKTYRHVLDRISAKDGHRSVHIPKEKAEKIIAEYADTPAMANLVLSVMRRIYYIAMKKMPSLRIRENPFALMDKLKTGTRHTWTDKELETYEAHWPVGTRERLAFDLLLYTGQRVSDVVRMRRDDIHMKSIPVTQRKTGAEVLIPIVPELEQSLVVSKASEYLMPNRDGSGMTEQTLTRLIRDGAKKAGLPKKCKAHGIRKATMRRLAERGKSSKQIAAISGHRTLKEVERYTMAAEQIRLARDAFDVG